MYLKVIPSLKFITYTSLTLSFSFTYDIQVSGNHAIPKEMLDLVGKSYLFKVEYKPKKNSQFEQSFRVKKICVDEATINKFKVV